MSVDFVLEEDEALDLLTTPNIRHLLHYEAFDLDMEAKAIYRDDPERAYQLKVIAARNFERMDSPRWHIPLKEAAMSYDRAAKNAESCGWYIAAIRCRIRACKLFNRLIDLGFIEHFDDLDYAGNHILELVEKV